MKSSIATRPGNSLVTLDEGELRKLGLTAADLAEISQVAMRIQPENPLTVSEFGRDVGEHTSRYADSLLDQVRNRDLDVAGEKLSAVVHVAKRMNLGVLSDKRSRLPIVGPLVDRIRLRSGRIMGEFDSTRQQIDSLVREVEATQSGIRERNAGLEDMHVGVREEHRLLGIHVAAGKMRLAEVRAQLVQLREGGQGDIQAAHEVADLETVATNLEKRINDLMVLQHSALQSLPMIRLIQSNNQMLADKFHTVREITVPAWKRQFMLKLTLNEQRNAVELADTIDNTTNDLLKRNAALLHRNSVETAKANQRLVIDVDTLREVQTTLIKSVEDVIRIHHEGIQSFRQAEAQIESMRSDLQAKLSRTPAAGTVSYQEAA
ncbi:toxic anion resistance protein [Acidovorax sp. SD340]|uniref:toxic anion resistance protein n=1 Tax=Acidovorax sp. SD340 TaxID=1690268 RepID=UPI0006DC65D9|nr:toxic anion resistance protein [Acidovorax sp. SD340]KQB57424.1 tellurium resistance protein [Acidovorax sp. SD340]MBO1010859.1 toxic anion resistance protein [Acidovorax sp. SD340]